MTTSLTKSPELKIVLKPEKDGQVEPVLLIGLEPSEELLEEVAGFKNPHYLVVVSSYNEYTLWDDDEGEPLVEREYHQANAYVFPMSKRQTEYVTFKRPGANRISACIIDVGRHNARAAWLINHRGKRVISWFSGRLDPGFEHTADTHVDIDLDKSVFADEPSGWSRAVVDHVFRGRGQDQCNFRKRLIAGLLAETVIQTIGLPLRILQLLFLWLMLCYDIDYRKLYGIEVTGLWNSAGASAWFESRSGVPRHIETGWKQLLPKLNPLMLAVYTAVVFAIPSAVFGIVSTKWDENTPPLADWGYWETWGITYKWIGIGLGCVAIVALAVYTLVTLVRKLIHRTPKPKSKPAPRYDVEELERQQKVAREAAAAARKRRLEELRGRTVAIPVSGAVPDSAQRGLWFKRLKRQVCKPFAS